jgi:hypothetical protein
MSGEIHGWKLQALNLEESLSLEPIVLGRRRKKRRTIALEPIANHWKRKRISFSCPCDIFISRVVLH